MHVINAYFTVPRAGALCLLSAAEPTALQSVRCFPITMAGSRGGAFCPITAVGGTSGEVILVHQERAKTPLYCCGVHPLYARPQFVWVGGWGYLRRGRVKNGIFCLEMLNAS